MSRHYNVAFRGKGKRAGQFFYIVERGNTRRSAEKRAEKTLKTAFKVSGGEYETAYVRFISYYFLDSRDRADQGGAGSAN